MSYTNNKSTKKFFCKVCRDAGKTESEYTSHFVRSLPDINGNTKITCPVLASTECRYCFEFGHTTKFCSVLEENKKRSDKAKSVAIRAQKVAERAATITLIDVVKKDVKYSGKFANLDEEEESNVDYNPAVVVDNFPSLMKQAKVVVPSGNSWSSIAAKPVANILPSINKPITKPETKKELVVRWVEESDSDDEIVYEAPVVETYYKPEVVDEWDRPASPEGYRSRVVAEDDEW